MGDMADWAIENAIIPNPDGDEQKEERMEKQLIQKAKDRIMRFLTTGKDQPRVRVYATNDIVYIVKHYGRTLRFKIDRAARLYLVSK